MTHPTHRDKNGQNRAVVTTESVTNWTANPSVEDRTLNPNTSIAFGAMRTKGSRLKTEGGKGQVEQGRQSQDSKDELYGKSRECPEKSCVSLLNIPNFSGFLCGRDLKVLHPLPHVGSGYSNQGGATSENKHICDALLVEEGDRLASPSQQLLEYAQQLKNEARLHNIKIEQMIKKLNKFMEDGK